MRVPVTVRLDVTQGAAPGQLMGRVVFEGQDGQIHEQGEPIRLEAGKSLPVSGVSAEYQLQGNLPTELTATPGHDKAADQQQGQAAGQKLPPGARR